MNPTKPTAAAMRAEIQRIIFRLFVSTECSWCRQTMRRAWLSWLGRGQKTHSICVHCFRKERLKLIKPIIGQLDEPQTPFVVLNLKSK